MTTPRTIEVELPPSLKLGEHEAELLKATFQAILSLRCESSCHWRELMQQLRDEGWQVTWGLRWQAQAAETARAPAAKRWTRRSISCASSLASTRHRSGPSAVSAPAAPEPTARHDSAR